MTDKINMYYAELPNMGDLLNIMLAKEVFGVKEVKRATPLTAEISGIGSGLGQFTYPEGKPLLKTVEFFTGKIYPKVHIWGTGFIFDKDWGKFYRKDMVFNAVRGELSRKKVENILGKSMDIPTGDGGIIVSDLFQKEIEKKYNVGVIPHFKEQNHPVFKQIADKFDSSTIIDLTEDPYKVIEDIASCEYIISSSLHGLITADAFNIPNHHIVVTTNLLGDGFKFDDYYSAYDRPHISTNVVDDGIDELGLNYVKENYVLTPELVEEKKKVMREAFPFKG